jgi:hypothetical protein
VGQKVIPKPSADYFVVGRRQKDIVASIFAKSVFFTFLQDGKLLEVF